MFFVFFPRLFHLPFLMIDYETLAKIEDATIVITFLPVVLFLEKFYFCSEACFHVATKEDTPVSNVFLSSASPTRRHLLQAVAAA